MTEVLSLVTTEMVSDGIGIIGLFGAAIAASVVVAGIVAVLTMLGITKGFKALLGHGNTHKDDLRYEEEKELARAQAADNARGDLSGSQRADEKEKQLASH